MKSDEAMGRFFTSSIIISFIWFSLLPIAGFAQQTLPEVLYTTYDFQSLKKQLGYDANTHTNATAEELEALDTYSEKFDSYYRDINKYLRNYPNPFYDWDSISPKQAKVIARNLNSYILKSPTLPKNLILFRGSSLSFRKNKSYKLNEVIQEKGFLSTSTSLDVAEFFATEQCDQPHSPNRKAIHILYSSKAPLVGALINQGENEVLLNSGHKLKIMQLKQHGAFDVYLTQICNKECDSKIPTQLLQWHKEVTLDPCKSTQ